MINDIIEINLNGKIYRGRLDMGAIANAQHNLKVIEENMGVAEMFDLVKKENYMVINNLIIESIKRCHPQLKAENILEDMKLHERNNITLQVFALMKAGLPSSDDDKKKQAE